MIDILTQQDFSMLVEELVHRNNDITYMEAIMEICDLRELEIEDVTKLIGPTIKEKLFYEGQNRNIFQKNGRLPL
jgi:hypothetical protein